MFSLPDNWEMASLLAKLLLYFAAFSIAGGSLAALRYSNGNRATLFSNFSTVFVGAVVGFHGVLLGFLVQVGLINDSGVGGMFDWGMASILLDTSLGDVTLFRLLAFILAGGASVVFLKKLQYTDGKLSVLLARFLFTIQFAALIILAFSHRVSGHVSVLSIVAQTSIMLHFIAFALWIGCLYPFLQLSKSTSLETLQKTLKRFGDNAIAILSILFLAGILMSWELLDSPFDLINTGYGVVLLVKLVLVAAILAVAAINKLVLVPSMLASVSISRLQTSIRVELAIALAILIVTSYLSTVVGPASHQM